MSEIDPARYRTLSFDCYGTLIDWENGILSYLQPFLQSKDVHVTDEFVLEFFAQQEPEIQAQGGAYRAVLAELLERLGERLAFKPEAEALEGFAASIERWPPFPDAVPALQALAERFDLAVLSNVDDDLFAFSAEQLGATFQQAITAEQVGVYKPHPKMFEALRVRVAAPILHVAQSRFHDIAPAQAAGLDTVWIDRPSLGAAKPAEVDPTWRFDSLAGLAAALLPRG